MWSFFSKDPSKDLNYELLESVSNGVLDDKTIWSVHNGRKKGTTTDLVTVFAFQARQGNESWLTIAKNGFKRMKSIRHPKILQYLDGLETDKALFVVTERVQPLFTYLNESTDNESQKENEISWGLHQIATGLNFLNQDCKLVHNNINFSSIFVNKAGEWKLCGLEFSYAYEQRAQIDSLILNKLPLLTKYEPPEKNNSSASELWSIDGWGLGCLIWEIFNGVLPNINALKNHGKIPKRLQVTYNELMNANPRNRLNALKFLEMCRKRNGFMDNHFVNTLLFLEQLQIKDTQEKTKFFSDLTDQLDDFPRNLCLYTILPQLINAYEFVAAGSSILAPLFKLGKLLDDQEYQKKIIPIVVKLFSSTDRTTRMRLLQQLDAFIEHLSSTVINDQIFPNLCQGFCDSIPAIRESTIRSIVLIAPKLNYNNLNIELMKHFARLQVTDDQGMIRTNTTVCIGKIAPYINPQLRQRILLSAFPKAMRDPFPATRLSGIIAFANTDRYYTLRDVASKVLPCLCLACVDPDKDVREESFKTIKMFLAKLEKVSENPDIAVELEKDVNSCTLDAKNETSWTSWAMTSLSTKLADYKNKSQQPSVALSTQSESKKTMDASPNTSMNASKQATPPGQQQQQQSQHKQQQQQGQAKSSPFSDEKSFTRSQASNSKAVEGWDDNEWKELDDDVTANDDDDQMEPLEDYFSAKNKIQGQSGASNANWASNLQAPPPAATTTRTNSQPSNNWSTGANANPYVNEEDLFTSLVKDVSLRNTAKTASVSSANQDQWQSFNDNWSSSEANNRQDRDERNAQKAREQAAKRQSKPLKLGAKKLND